MWQSNREGEGGKRLSDQKEQIGTVYNILGLEPPEIDLEDQYLREMTAEQRVSEKKLLRGVRGRLKRMMRDNVK